MCSFPNFEPVCCSMSGSHYCLLTCIQFSQEAGQVVWHSHTFKNFPQFVVIHTVSNAGIFNPCTLSSCCPKEYWRPCMTPLWVISTSASPCPFSWSNERPELRLEFFPLYSTGNSAQGYVAAWMRGEFRGEWVYVYVWLSPFAIHPKQLSQHC